MSIKTKSLADLAYDRLRSGIMSGHFKAGERLSMRALSRSYGISTTPVRDAALRLVQEGAMDQPNSRVFELRKLSVEEFEEIQDMRVCLEGLAARHAARRISPAVLDHLKSLHQCFVEGISENPRQANAYNTDFHLGIAKTAELSHLLRVIENLWLFVGPLFLELHKRMESEAFLPASHRHNSILDSLEARDEVGAEAAMRADIRWGTEMVLSLGGPAKL